MMSVGSCRVEMMQRKALLESFIPDSVTRQQMCSCISSCISDKKSYKKSKRVVVI